MSGAVSLPCPLCSKAVPPSSLEAHLRYELSAPLLKCLRCHLSFCDEREAEEHCAARHSGLQPELIRPPDDPETSDRLSELLRLARGGPEAVQQRLCVCGHCRLLCREDFRATSGQVYQNIQPASGGRAESTAREPLRASNEPIQDAKAEECESKPERSAADPEQGLAVRKELWMSEDVILASERDAGSDSGGFSLAQQQRPSSHTSSIDRSSPADWLGSDALSTHATEPREERDSEPIVDDSQEEACESERPVEESIAEAPISRKRFRRPTTELDSGDEEASDVEIQATKEASIAEPPKPPKRSRNQEPNVGDDQDEILSETEPQMSLDHSPKPPKRRRRPKVRSEPPPTNYAQTRCGPCNRLVQNQIHAILQHIAVYHLKKPLHRCRQCERTSTHYAPNSLRAHARTAHRGTPAQHSVDSSGLEAQRETLQAMIGELFGE